MNEIYDGFPSISSVAFGKRSCILYINQSSDGLYPAFGLGADGLSYTMDKLNFFGVSYMHKLNRTGRIEIQGYKMEFLYGIIMSSPRWPPRACFFTHLQ